jgi:hypothetical protein
VWEKLSALVASCDAQKARGFAIAGKSRSAHAPSPVFHAPENPLCRASLR